MAVEIPRPQVFPPRARRPSRSPCALATPASPSPPRQPLVTFAPLARPRQAPEKTETLAVSGEQRSDVRNLNGVVMTPLQVSAYLGLTDIGELSKDSDVPTSELFVIIQTNEALSNDADTGKRSTLDLFAGQAASADSEDDFVSQDEKDLFDTFATLLDVTFDLRLGASPSQIKERRSRALDLFATKLKSNQVYPVPQHALSSWINMSEWCTVTDFGAHRPPKGWGIRFIDDLSEDKALPEGTSVQDVVVDITMWLKTYVPEGRLTVWAPLLANPGRLVAYLTALMEYIFEDPHLLPRLTGRIDQSIDRYEFLSDEKHAFDQILDWHDLTKALGQAIEFIYFGLEIHRGYAHFPHVLLTLPQGVLVFTHLVYFSK